MTRYTLHSGVLRALRTTALPLVLLHAVSCGDDPNGPPPATTVTVSPSTSTRVAGQTQQFTATVANQPAGSAVVWSSANTAVATVNASTGLATGVAAGTTKIRATVGAAFGEADLTVTANTAPTVEAGVDRDVNRGEAISISTVASDPQGQELTYSWTQLAGTPVTMTNPGSATLSVTAPSGVTVLRFRVTVSDGSLSSSDEVGVFVFEDKAKAFFVRPNGDDAAAGTRAAPFKTLAKAIQTAAATQADVYAATGTYGERVVLQTGVSLYGGFESAWTGRAPASAGVTSTIVGDGTGVLGASVSGLTVDGFDIESGPASTLGFGNSTYGVRLQSAQNVTISNNAIAAAEGRVGLLGTNGIIGGSGLGGSNAGANRGGAGGLGGSGVGSAGGTGGDAGTIGQSGSPGSTGDRGAAGGNGGTGGTTLAPDGTAGGNGQNGTVGAVGGPGPVGTFAAAGYAPAQAATGQNGGSGGGGGGGGGGRNTSSGDQVFTGGGGGGGGGGGQGGGGGEGGTGGGGSFGVYVAQSTGITVTGNTIATAGGGVGGAGGQGGAGGLGNVGGAGSTLVEGGKGGAGGRGGDGAHGGRGGGGAGGPSITIVSVGSTVTQSGNTLQPGAGGAGGAPNGITGTSQATRTDP